jgi:hypothetical protein
MGSTAARLARARWVAKLKVYDIECTEPSPSAAAGSSNSVKIDAPSKLWYARATTFRELG